MYTNAPFQQRLRANASGASASAAKLSPLPSQGNRGLTPPPPLPRSSSSDVLPRASRSVPRSPIQRYPASLPTSPPQTGRSPHILMDPLAALRRCLQYVCSHPEVYGDDVRGLLDREVMHVVRLKASEVSLTNGQRPLLMDPLESGSARRSGAAAAAAGTRNATGNAALPTIAASSAQQHQQQQYSSGSGGVAGAVPAGDLFGYGSVSFLPASTAGFGGLQLEARDTWGRAGGDDGGAETDTFFPGGARHGAMLSPLDETIQWGGTLPPTSSHDSTGLGIRGIAREAVRDGEGTAAAAGTIRSENAGGGSAVLGRKSYSGVQVLPPGVTSTDGQIRYAQSPQSLVLVNSGDAVGAPVAAVPNAFCAADGTVMVVDQQGYEVTYLRTQLQQLEAAFNAKCVRLHELEVENRQFADKMKAAEEAAARWSAQHHTMQGQLEVMRRELDGWKDRASDAVAAATKQSKQRSQHAKQIASTQLTDARHEISRLGQLWRETERALQETRRAFENTEKEATAAHNHLADAFHYLERLERRVARRDAYVALCERRQRSLEEKYDKLRWGFEELSALEGRYSYVDYMLTTKPLWSVYMFLCLARHLGDYVALENPLEAQQRLMRMVEQAAGEAEVPVDAVAAAAAALEPLYALLVSRTPHGGRLVALHYDLRLIFSTMRDEVTAALNRRGRPKQLRTTLHGSVACRAIRWHERYSIDYLRGVESDPDSGELNRKFVPVLSLASVLLPLRSRAGALLVQPTAAVPDEAAAADPEVAGAQAKAEEERVLRVLSTVPNKRHYDQATIRFVLRCFWKERLGGFTAQMKARIAKMTEQEAAGQGTHSSQEGSAAAAARKFSETSATLAGADASSEHLDEDMDEVFVQTFLAALVDFATRFTADQGVSSGGSGNAAAPPMTFGGVMKVGEMPSRDMLLSVRGVLAGGAAVGKPASRVVPGDASKSATESVWDSGRVFFATVLRPVAAPTRSVSHRDDSHASFSKLPVEDEEVKTLAEDARELLSALYYYTLEYKDQDPDFRLFYLVSHQLIPEMVAVNFFAGIDALQQDGVAMLETRLQYLPSGCYSTASFVGDANDAASNVSGGAASSQVGAAAEMPKEVEDPLTALTRAVEIMDDALLDGEEDDVEPDSDGEGYGTILPFHATAATRPQRRASASPAGTPQVSQVVRREAEAEAPTAASTVLPLRARELRLLHNIRSYLRSRRSSMQGGGVSSAGSVSVGVRASVSKAAEPSAAVSEEEVDDDDLGSPTATRLATFSFGDAPPEWTELERAVVHCLGPHTALLEVFRQQYRKRPDAADNAAGTSARAKASILSVSSPASPTPQAGSSPGKELDYLRRRRAHRKRRHETTKYLSATRGLISEEDAMALVQRHCLATYAVSCCGTPRFSLLRPLLHRRGSRVEDEEGQAAGPPGLAQLDPYTVVGHLPLTGLHLQRLRFALSLDQPSHLVRLSGLFAVDAATKTNSHFYDTYLTIVLDTFEQQQSFLMQSVLRSCAVRHERYAAEGAEDCDGQVPIARLKNGLTAALSAIRGTAQHAQALVNHFVQYDELLRLEDGVKLEQFADAPLLLNVPPMEEHSAGSAADAEGSVSQSAASRRRSIAESLVEEGDRGNFNLHEEADGCSLLHIAFAVRMTYVVWGPVSKPIAEALVHRVVRREAPTCCCDEAGPDTARAPGAHAAALSAKPTAQRDATVVTELPEWDVFDQATRRAYAQTLRRLETGHNGDANPLRRVLGILESEQPRLPTNLGSRATMAQRPSDDIDPFALYPDVANVWTSKKVLAAGEARLEAIAAAAAAAAGGAGGASGAGAAGKGKKKGRMSQSRRSLTTPSVAGTAGDGTTSDADAAAEAPPLPDYGLLSLARSLGFAPPVPAGGPFPSAMAQGAGKKGGAGAAAKKSGKKGGAAAKGGAATDAAVSPAVQEAYGGGLALQLQDLASRVAALMPLEPVYFASNVSVEPSQASAFTTPGRISTANASVSSQFAATAGPASQAASTGRTRSAAFTNVSRKGSAQAKQRRTVTVEAPSDTRANSQAGWEAPAATWVPVFPYRPVALDDAAPPPPSGVPVDVSKLYPICAALSMT